MKKATNLSVKTRIKNHFLDNKSKYLYLFAIPAATLSVFLHLTLLGIFYLTFSDNVLVEITEYKGEKPVSGILLVKNGKTQFVETLTSCNPDALTETAEVKIPNFWQNILTEHTVEIGNFNFFISKADPTK